MWGLIAGLAAAAQAPQAARPLSDDPDLRCMVAISLVIGTADGTPADSAEKASMASIMMYYVGRIDARFPGIDYVREVKRLVEAPGYMENKLAADLERCGSEAEARGKLLQDMGEELQRTAPLSDSSRG